MPKVAFVYLVSSRADAARQSAEDGCPRAACRRFLPSTKPCHVYGNLSAFITLRDRVWMCMCGVAHNHDRNPAINIYREGASPRGQGRCETSVLAAAVTPSNPVGFRHVVMSKTH
jgi:hypothetical protein